MTYIRGATFIQCDHVDCYTVLPVAHLRNGTLDPARGWLARTSATRSLRLRHRCPAHADDWRQTRCQTCQQTDCSHDVRIFEQYDIDAIGELDSDEETHP